MMLRRLHQRLLTIMGLAAVVAFLSGVGIETPTILLTTALLLLALVWQPGVRTHERLEWVFRIAAFLLMVRAIYYMVALPEDVVLPMVDVLLVLVASEALRPEEVTAQTRMYSLAFALLLAASAYRAGVAFGLAFIVFLMTGTITLMIGHLLRQAAKHRMPDPVLERGFLVRVALLSFVMLFMSGLLFVAFPRVTRQWMGRGVSLTNSVIGFSDRVSLGDHGSRLYPNPEVVLRVEFASQRPPDEALYWRGRSYEVFDGVAWSRTARLYRREPRGGFYRERWAQPPVEQFIYAAPLDVNVVFALSPVVDLSGGNRYLRFDRTPTGDLFFRGTPAPTYHAVSLPAQPTDEEIRGKPAAYAPGDSTFLQLPALSGRVHQLADSLTADHQHRLDKARAIERYLRTQFRYTLDLPATAAETGLEYFLFQRRAGHCEYFSTAMVILLRSVGIPARNVNGFLGGQWNEFGNFLTVTQNQAHSWVEVYFPDWGWIRFDPTPAASGGVATAQQRFFGPFRFLIDGLEHRWSKWVLEYDLDTQTGVFRRTAAAISPDRAPRESAVPPGTRSWWLWAAGAFVLIIVIRTLLLRRSTMEAGFETRTYLKLRRAYRRAGFDPRPWLPPLAFIEQMELAHAPGAAHARQVVLLYLESRFGNAPVAKQSIRAEAERALHDLRRRKRQPA